MREVEELAVHMLQKGVAASYSEALEKAEAIFEVEERVKGKSREEQKKLTEIEPAKIVDESERKIIKELWDDGDEITTHEKTEVLELTDEQEQLSEELDDIFEEAGETQPEMPAHKIEDSQKIEPKAKPDEYKEKIIQVYDEIDKSMKEEKEIIEKERLEKRHQPDYDVKSEELTLKELMEEDARLIYGLDTKKDEIEAFERFEDTSEPIKKTEEKPVLEEENSIIEDV